MESLHTDSQEFCLWPQQPTIEYIDNFVSAREKYRETKDPIRTLQYAFMDEVAEIVTELTKAESVQTKPLTEELGDGVIMGVLLARHQDLKLSNIIEHSTLGEFQHHLDPSEKFNYKTFSVAAMNVLNITYSEAGDSDVLYEYFRQLAGLASSHSIELDDCVREVVSKLTTRKRQNHSVKYAGDSIKPNTHTGRYLVKMGEPLERVIEFESRHSGWSGRQTN